MDDADPPDDGEASDDGEADPTGDDGLTYAEAGVDVAASEAATAALVARLGGASGDYAGLLDVGDRYLALSTDGVGTKILVAEALDDYSTIGVDCVAMNANDLVAAGVRPRAFVDYLAVAEPDESVAAAVGEGLAAGAELAGVELVGGETAVMPEVVRGVDLAGTCAGLAPKEAVFPGEARVGDALVAWRSTGVHSNGLTLAREVVARAGGYDEPCPFDGYGTLGEALLEPTRIYADLLDPMREAGVRAAAHVTGGGWRNLARMGARRYEVTDAFEPPAVFEFLREAGGVSETELHRTFNVGTGFVAALDPDAAAALAAETDGRVVGRVEAGGGADGVVAVRGLELAGGA
jgi:phosphoribosylformylglycinamidine cyclo-ligase